MQNVVTPTESLATHLSTLFTAEQLDTAMDKAAKCSSATVAIFAAAPVECWDDEESAAIEFAVEFFVPPPSLQLFQRELEAQLLRSSPPYVTARYRGQFGPAILRNIPNGTFHQYRIAWRSTETLLRDGRWSRDRDLVQAVLHQARTGWREIAS